MVTTATPTRRGTGRSGAGLATALLVIAALVIIGLILWALFAADEEEVRVVGVDDFPAIVAGETGALGTDDRVQVVGTVRLFNIADIEREIGYDLDDSVYEAWEGEPVVVASAIDRTVLRPAYDGAAGYGLGADNNVQLTTIEDVAEEPNNYIGQRVVLTGEVEELIGLRGFVLEED